MRWSARLEATPAKIRFARARFMLTARIGFDPKRLKLALNRSNAFTGISVGANSTHCPKTSAVATSRLACLSISVSTIFL